MKIVYIASAFIPSRSAYSIHVMKMCQAFALSGHEVTLLIPHNRNREPGVDDVYAYYGVQSVFKIRRLLWLDMKGGGYLYGLQAGGAARLYKPDLVYGRFLSGCFFSALLGLPVVFEVHAPMRDSGRFSDWLLKRLVALPRLRRIISISEALRKDYLHHYSLPLEKIDVAADAADRMNGPRKPLSLGEKGERLQVGYVGHLYPGKGMELISRLVELCPWADFHVVGGMSEDIEYWQNRLSLIPNITFHGYVPNSETVRYLLAFDVVLAPYLKNVSVHGGKGDVGRWMSPLKIFEYMAAGRPIVCSDLPVLHEVLSHNRTALFCAEENEQEWANALETLSVDTVLRRHLGDSARELFETKFSWEVRVEKVLSGLPS